MAVPELKFYQRLDKLKDLSDVPWGGIAYDYPMFFRFTSEDKDRIQRNYVKAINEGLSPDFRKICVTSSCVEGFTLRDLMEIFNQIEEVPEHVFEAFAAIPHWNPIEKLDGLLATYVRAMEEVQQENDKDEVKQMFTEVLSKEINDLPGGNYRQMSKEKDAKHS